VATLQADVSTSAAAEAAFQRGATAVVGWPFEDPLPAASARSQRSGETQAVLQLIQGVDRDEPVGRLEAVLKRDPALAFKLLKYMNSPGIGLSVEVNSFRHAIMLMGYQKLKRWLALLLATAGKDNNLRPVMFAAVRRGMLMEELTRATSDEAMRNEIFICGVFSLLDLMFRQPFEQLLQSLPVGERVRQALLEQTGPYQPFLELVKAIEAESRVDYLQAADHLLLSVTEINRAVLRSLGTAIQLG
jgi:EAL and modified HD-GYP domain-containing signal transduction protein